MRLFSRRNRPPHLGKYPMEKIKRVPKTTTYISDDVPRVPKRANFFNRAMLGDLGPKLQRERPRFVNKLPFARAMGKLCRVHMPMHDGDAFDSKAPLPEDLTERANHFKSLCYFLNGDVVGTCEIPEHAWYSHDEQGNAIEPYHKFAIVVLVDQGFETLDALSGPIGIRRAPDTELAVSAALHRGGRRMSTWGIAVMALVALATRPKRTGVSDGTETSANS